MWQTTLRPHCSLESPSRLSGIQTCSSEGNKGMGVCLELCTRQGQLGVASRVNSDGRNLETGSSFRYRELRWQGMEKWGQGRWHSGPGGDRPPQVIARSRNGARGQRPMECGQVSVVLPDDQGVPDVRHPGVLRPPSYVGSPLRHSCFAPGKEAVWFLEGECRHHH